MEGVRACTLLMCFHREKNTGVFELPPFLGDSMLLQRALSRVNKEQVLLNENAQSDQINELQR